MINPITKYLNELWQMKISGSHESLYHTSLTQNLKQITPSMDPSIKRSVVWASFYLPYAALFAMPHTLSRFTGVDCDPTEVGYCDYWVVEITNKSKSYLRKPCSIYTIKPIDYPWEKASSTLSASKYLPGYISSGNCQVIKEEKYKSVHQCFLKNQVGIVFRDPRYGY